MCIQGDQRLVEETSKAFKKDKKLVKGIAFPTCISVNNCICHYSPLTTEADTIFADGDMGRVMADAVVYRYTCRERDSFD